MPCILASTIILFHPNMHFGEQLKKLRIELGLGQKEMADRLSIDVSTYSRWEHKERPAMHVIERVSKVFGVQAIDWVREPEARAEEAPSAGPRVVHLKSENDATHADPHENERLRLFNRMLDFFERMFGKLGGGSNRLSSRPLKRRAPALRGRRLTMVYGTWF